MARKEKPLEYGVLYDSTPYNKPRLSSSERKPGGKLAIVYRIQKHFDFFHGHLGKLLVSVQVDTVANEASFSAFENAEVLSSIFANH